MINDLKENSNNQVNEEWKKLGKKFGNMDKKIRKEIETLKYKLRNIENEKWQSKFTKRLGQSEDRLSGIEDSQGNSTFRHQ